MVKKIVNQLKNATAWKKKSFNPFVADKLFGGRPKTLMDLWGKLRISSYKSRNFEPGSIESSYPTLNQEILNLESGMFKPRSGKY